MELCPRSKILFLILTAFIVFSVIFTIVLAASILDHECIGEANGCPFCLQIKIAKIFLKTLKMAAIFAFFTLFLLYNYTYEY
jgi:ABC-type spermidine/putrescine transport system permease subunit I